MYSRHLMEQKTEQIWGQVINSCVHNSNICSRLKCRVQIIVLSGRGDYFQSLSSGYKHCRGRSGHHVLYSSP